MQNFSEVLSVAMSSGFDLGGVAKHVVDKSEWEFFNKWLADGCAAGMKEWMERGSSKRADPSLILEDVKSVICLAVNYYPGDHKSDTGLVARYAWGDNYHEVIGSMCKKVCDFLIKNYGDSPKCYTDTGAILERYFAVKSGLGFIGKNTCLITPEFGSWVFLSVIFSKIEFEPTSHVATGKCGPCERCIKACPTGALSEKRVDARKCISYLTIEKRGPFSDEERSMVTGQNFCFGCDICQSVCPHNVRAKKTGKFNPRVESLSTGQLDTLDLKKSPLGRAKREGLERNLGK
ncbi:tRNA epoxyqueuosine(34) reductase QueG [Candidatus Peregrinibacteria bacterium RIFOXYB12_FULL_41_12]|nr:MAG: tRNA epoxyqueuosine(34) reductase QueG [Candidatus Peregrinibacteria bacterium RIFOXYB12_FULL_41_12]OGJ48318.1 MAG: tRNA epoxyqueuosine(34) reductase QueG [Candidatus Peregrinibacteria bacterium RIFOXYA2_FULL_41_18]OGJ53327.1 MAG: tRNA epoxyqueuosine(34) reductase QueG [Candidatus Peregrinibacteria bacterium RIFOXYC2_FULL_41_22]OGJ54288.1 MAG: tRNA epoxyqueuosine(34) reductase QueG [Candidatus Peregrinibacteria bacterium RIFOXYB2_FULL_41_88]